MHPGLGLTSPPSQVLCSTKTASAHPGRFAPHSLPGTCTRGSCRSCPHPARQARLGPCPRSAPDARALDPPVPLILRLPPCRRQEALPSFRATPICTCPALRSRREPSTSPLRCPVCCLPVHSSRRLSASRNAYAIVRHCTYFGTPSRGLRARLPSASHTSSQRSHFRSASGLVASL
jgi:hypothetical protein